MSAFNTEHIPVSERDVTGPDRRYGQWLRYQVVFACGKAAPRGDASMYMPARNRRMCPRCEAAVTEGRAVPMPRPRHWNITRHTRTGQDQAGNPTLACGAHWQDAQQAVDEAGPPRECTGCRQAQDPGGGHEERRRLRMARTARDVYMAIRTATSGPDPKPLAYSTQTGRSGFFRPDHRGQRQGNRIMEHACSLMENAARAVPWELRGCLAYEDGYLVARPGCDTLCLEYFGLWLDRTGGALHHPFGGGQPPEPGPRQELEDAVERVRTQVTERMPEAREHAWSTIAEALTPFGFVLKEHGPGARRLVSMGWAQREERE